MAMNDAGKLVLRLTVGLLMMFHGIAKLRHGVAWMRGPLAAHHLPAFLAYGVYIAEVVVPILLIIGLFTRVAAAVLIFEMIMAVYLILGIRAFQLDKQTGALGMELQCFYAFAALSIMLLGSGRYAIRIRTSSGAAR